MMQNSGRKLEFAKEIAKVHRVSFSKLVQRMESREGQCFEEILKTYFGECPDEKLLQLFYAFKLSVGRSVACIISQLIKDRSEANIELIEKIAALSRVS